MVEYCDLFQEKKSLFVKRDARVMYEGVRPTGLAIGTFSHVERDGWFYRSSNQIPSLDLVQIDKLLMLWGIRSMNLKDSLDSKRRTFNRALYQRILHIFMTIMLCRWLLLTLTEVSPINQDLYSCLGDFMQGYGSKYSRFVYKVEILFPAIITLITHTLAGVWERDGKRNKWLHILSFMDRKRKHKSYGLPEGVATNVWIKGLKNLKFLLPILLGALATTLGAIVLQCQLNRVEGDRVEGDRVEGGRWFWTGMDIRWFWTGMDMVWLGFLSLHFVGFVLIFDLFAHYFDVRTEKLVYDIEQIYKYKDELTGSERCNVIWTMLKEFNAICVQLNDVDHFWQYFLFLMLQLGPFAILVGLNNNILFGTRMKSPFHYSMIWILTLVICFLWISFVLSVSKVSTRMHQVYLILNRACLIPVDDSMKVRLEHAVKRFDGLHIGFNCFNMFTIGHEYLYHVSDSLPLILLILLLPSR